MSTEMKNFPHIYRGEVVNVDDLERRNGLAQIFVPGVYPEESRDSKNLPWAEPAMPLYGECNKYSGTWARPAVGSHVWVFFEGGDHMKPVFFATIPSGKWLLSSGPGKYATATRSTIFAIDETAIQNLPTSTSPLDLSNISPGDINLPGCVFVTNAVDAGSTNATLILNGMLNIIATNGAFINGMPILSDRNQKTEIESIDTENILEKACAVPTYKWKYRNDFDENIHIGPMAQDFNAQFGNSDKCTIDMIDLTGVTFSSISQLHKNNQMLAERVSKLEGMLDELSKRIS